MTRLTSDSEPTPRARAGNTRRARVAFLLAIKGPTAVVRPLSAIVFVVVPEKVFEAMLSGERITFEVEEDVPIAWLRQIRQAEAGLDRQQWLLEKMGLAATANR